MTREDLLRQPEPRLYLLGTDSLGRDLLSRLLFAVRHSVRIAALCAAMALGLGTLVGAFAGLAGGIWDALLMRAVDVLMSIPRLLLFLVCAALFRPSTPLLILALGATTWTGLARLVRSETKVLREGPMILAARAAGASRRRQLLRHVVPQLGPLLGVAASLRFADTLLAESALSFLGLGAPPPAVSLGEIIAGGRGAPAEAWWTVVFPGTTLVVLTLSVRLAAARLFRSSDPPSVA